MAARDMARRREVDIRIPALMAALMDTIITITRTIVTPIRTPIPTLTREIWTTRITSTDPSRQHPLPCLRQTPAALGRDHREPARRT